MVNVSIEKGGAQIELSDGRKFKLGIWEFLRIYDSVPLEFLGAVLEERYREHLKKTAPVIQIV